MEKNRFTKKRHSAIRLSSWMRSNLATQKVQGMRRECAAELERIETIRKDVAATKIQARLRTRPLSQHFQRIRLAVVCIQNAVQARRQRLHATSSIIQTAWRTHMTQAKNRAIFTIQRVYRKYAIRRGPLAKLKTKPKSILRKSGKKLHVRSMSETSRSTLTKYPSSVFSATEMLHSAPPSPNSGFMHSMERSLDCLICNCPGSNSSVAAAVAE